MKEIGSMIRQRGLEFILTWMELSMKVSGKKTNNTAKEKKLGLTEQCTKVNMFMGRNMVLVSFSGLTNLSTLVSSITTT